MRTTFLFVLFVILSSSVFAQFQIQGQTQINTRIPSGYRAVVVDSQKFVFSYWVKRTIFHNVIKYGLYDKDLKNLDERVYVFPRMFYLARAAGNEEDVYYVYKHFTRNKFIFLRFKLPSMQIQEAEFNVPNRFTIYYSFYFANDTLYFTGINPLSSGAKVFKFCSRSNRLIDNTILSGKKVSYIGSSVIGGRLYYFYTDRKKENVQHLYVYDGQKIIDIPGQKFRFVRATAIQAGDSIIIAGAYSKSSWSSANQGLYLAFLTPGSQQIKFYQFSDFDSIYNYLPSKLRKWKISRIKRRDSLGKTVSIGWPVIVAKPILWHDKILLLAQAYYIDYTTKVFYNQNNMAYYNGSADMQLNNNLPQTEFNGYVYTHAILAAMDRNGKKLWDQSFAVDKNEDWLQLQQIIYPVVFAHKIGFVFPQRQNARYVCYSPGGQKICSDTLILSDVFNKAKVWPKGKFYFKPWHDNVFLFYGAMRKKDVNGHVKRFISLFKLKVD